MHSALALVRQDLLTALSYRVNSLLRFVGLIISVAPIYFVANALQPTMANSISHQGDHYFAFLIVGMVGIRLALAATRSLPSAISSGVRSGTLECLFATPASLSAVIPGLMGYKILWALLESSALLSTAVLLGAHVYPSQFLLGALVLSLIVVAYASIGLVAAGLVLLYRTTGPLIGIAMAGSALLGGVYYPTSVIPSWIHDLSAVVPLTYGLRALRQTWLENHPVERIGTDLAILSVIALLGAAAGLWFFAYAMRRARSSGTLSQY